MYLEVNFCKSNKEEGRAANVNLNSAIEAPDTGSHVQWMSVD